MSETVPIQSQYYTSTLPGRKTGINGSCLGGFNIGISKYSSKVKKKAAIEVIKFFTSQEIQKNIVIKKSKLFSGLTKLYNDTEVCSYINCEFIEKVQSIHRPSAIVDNYDSYTNRMKKLLFEFLYGDRSAKDVLMDMDNITRIHFFSTSSSIGFTMMMFLILGIIINFLSLIVIVRKKYKPIFHSYSNLHWILYGIGTIFITCAALTQFQTQTNNKCQTEYSLFFIGLSLNYINLILILYIYLEKHNFSNMFIGHTYTTIMVITILDIIIDIVTILIPNYSTKLVLLENSEYNKIYSKCIVENTSGNIIILFQIIMKLFLLIIISLLLYIEWNIKKAYCDLRSIFSTMYINVTLLTLLITINYVHINDYIVYNSLQSLISIVFSFTNYITICLFRITFINKNILLEKMNTNTINIIKNKLDIYTISKVDRSIFCSTDYENNRFEIIYKNNKINNTNNNIKIQFDLF